MAKSFVMEHIKRADGNLLGLCIVICIVCSLITFIVGFGGGLHTPFYWCLSITILIIAICAFAYIDRVSNLKHRPIFRELRRFGDFDSIRAQIDADVAFSAPVSKGELLFTQNWILKSKFSGLHVIHRPTLVWAYAKDLATSHYVNFIPTGTTHTYSVLLHYTEPARRQGFITMRNLEIKTENKEESGDLLGYILLYAPWIVAGYTPEIAILWRVKTSEMLATVANRYNAFIFGTAKQKEQQRIYAERPATKVDMHLFEVLGVSPSATEAEVKAAYRSKAWVAHPDHGGSNELMMEVNVAYETICKSKGWSV